MTPDNTLSFIIANTPIGTRVPVTVIRGGQRLTLLATIGERPSEAVLQGLPPESETPRGGRPGDDGAEAARQSLGLTLQVLTPEIRQQLRLPDSVQGLVIARVNPASSAAEQGLQRGDVVLSINQRPVRTPQDAAAAVAEARRAGRDTVLLLVQRGNGPARFVGVKLR